MTTPPSSASRLGIPERKSIEPPVRKPSSRASTASSLARATTPSRDDCAYTESEGKSPVIKEDVRRRQSRSVEKPNEILHRLYSIWPTQLTASYRPHAVGNPEATAELNLRYIRELYPRYKLPHKADAKTVGMAVQAVFYMEKKAQHTINLGKLPRQHESGGKVTTSLTKKKGGKAAVQDASLVMSNTNPRRVSAK